MASMTPPTCYPVAAACEQPVVCAGDYSSRAGVARIAVNHGDGSYTIVEQRHDPGAGAWVDVACELGHRLTVGIDYQGRQTGSVGRRVPFWEHRGLGGAVVPLIDVTGEGMVKVSANDAGLAPLVDKLVGDDGEGENLKVSLVEQDDGSDETLKIVIRKEDLTVSAGIATAMLHRIRIPDGADAGSFVFSTEDHRGRLLLCALQALYSDTPGGEQWGGGATSGLTRFFGATWDTAPDRTLVGTSGSSLVVKIQPGSGYLLWSWADNDSGMDLHGICLIQATSVHTAPDYTP
jgi:hypothetical protein